MSTAERRLVAERASRAGAEAGLDGNDLHVRARGRELRLTLPTDWDLLDLRHALPGRARGDQREMLLAAIVQDAAPGVRRSQYDELRDALAEPGVLPAEDEVQRHVLAAVMREHYWVRPETTGSGATRPFVFPFHAALPANFTQRGRYKMFRSDILLFLCWDGSDIDPAPVHALCELLSDRDDVTLLDDLLIEATLRRAGAGARDRVSADDLLRSDQATKVRDYLCHGAFYQPALDRFRADMLAALGMRLPRHDRVAAAILTLSLHLALYYYEVSFRLGSGLDEATRAAAGLKPAADQSFAGALRFRVGTSGDRPVRRADACAAAWRELDDRYLISLTPSILVTNLLHHAWRAADAAAPVNANPGALAAAMHTDRALAALIDAAAGALAISYSARAAAETGPALAHLAAREEPGVHLLRDAVHRHQRRTLHYRSRAVVNLLVKRSFGGSLIRRRGNVLFFELDEELLFLLVKFVLQRAGEVEMPFREFLADLAAYGLAPQDAAEEEQLAGALERLGMLQRYSDAGEAVYVRHLL